MLSYLPMCYTLERCCQMVTVLGGGEGIKVQDSGFYQNFQVGLDFMVAA